MKYSIHQVDATTWELRSDDTVVGSFTNAPGGRTGYDLATLALGTLLKSELAADDGAAVGDGLLPEAWESDQGLAFKKLLPGGRDFRECAFTWRDPATCLVPLMLQTETEYGHMGAELAGFVESFKGSDPVGGGGRFYDNEAGVAFRDLLLDGRRFGVSVDPSEAVDVEESWECTEWDDEGFCEAGEYSMKFMAYEIAGVTGTPFPGFEEAAIVLTTSGAASTRPVRAALSIPTKPPAAWMRLAEPRPGVAFLDGMGDDVLVEQLSASGQIAGMAVPLTIRDDGLVYAHLTWWGECHVGDPWGPGVCASASTSKTGYREFLVGATVCDDGTEVPTGVLSVGCEHSSAFTASGVRDHLAHAGMGWASVTVVDGEYGPWMCGVLHPELTESQVAVLRRLSLSGEWVGDLAGVLAVNTPGLPVQRALAASAFGDHGIPMPVLRSSARSGEVTKLVGSNIVRRCVECEKRRLSRSSSEPSLVDVMAMLRVLDLRTAHLAAPAADALRASFES